MADEALPRAAMRISREERLRSRSGWRTELPRSTRAKPETVPCAAAERLRHDAEPILTRLEADLPRVSVENRPAVFAQARLNLFLCLERAVTQAPPKHKNGVGRTAHPCVLDAVRDLLVLRFWPLEQRFLEPVFDLRKKTPVTPVATSSLVRQALGIAGEE